MKKNLAIRPSEISGWGAFILETAKKNDLIGEYLGEMITSNEAERRGTLYDYQKSNYMFKLNDSKCEFFKISFSFHADFENEIFFLVISFDDFFPSIIT